MKRFIEYTRQSLNEADSDGKHAFLNQEKGPNRMEGVALRVLIPHSTAQGGFTRTVYDFWGSTQKFKSGAKGMNGYTRSDIESKGIKIHPDVDSAYKAAKKDAGMNESGQLNEMEVIDAVEDAYRDFREGVAMSVKAIKHEAKRDGELYAAMNGAMDDIEELSDRFITHLEQIAKEELDPDF